MQKLDRRRTGQEEGTATDLSSRQSEQHSFDQINLTPNPTGEGGYSQSVGFTGF